MEPEGLELVRVIGCGHVEQVTIPSTLHLTKPTPRRRLGVLPETD